MPTAVSAIILAAGASLRMGRPKALLEIKKKTFLQHIIDTLESARMEEIIVVLGADAEEVSPSLSSFKGRVAVNRDWRAGQLSSLIAGLDTVDRIRAEGVLVWPVDHPLIHESLVNELVQVFRASRKKIVVPVFKGRRGHPVIFSTSLMGELRASPADVGARAVIRNHPEEICEVVTTAEGILMNIDTPEHYRQYCLSKD